MDEGGQRGMWKVAERLKREGRQRRQLAVTDPGSTDIGRQI